MADRFDTWRDTVLARVRFRPDRERIGQELAEHWEDHREDLLRLGFSAEEAEERTLAAMGDPAEIGQALNREHSPVLGWLWVASRWGVRCACGLLILLILTGAVPWEALRATLGLPGGDGAAAENLFLNPPADLCSEQLPGWTCVAEGSTPSSARARDYTLTVDRAVEWETAGGFYEVYLLLTVTPNRPWYGLEVEFTDSLRFRYNGGEIANTRDRQNGNVGAWPPPWASAGRASDAGAGLGKSVYTVTIALEEPADWLEITYPYGDNDWVLRVELEDAV